MKRVAAAKKKDSLDPFASDDEEQIKVCWDRYQKKNVVFQAKLLLEAIFTYLTDTQVQKGQGVLGSLDPFILDLELICWCSMAILDLYIYFK